MDGMDHPDGKGRRRRMMITHTFADDEKKPPMGQRTNRSIPEGTDGMEEKRCRDEKGWKMEDGDRWEEFFLE